MCATSSRFYIAARMEAHDPERNKRVTVREGYDLWAGTTLNLLDPKPGEKILDAGCGTGRNLARISRAGATPYGLDFSFGMLRVAKENVPHVPSISNSAVLGRALRINWRTY